MTRILAFSDMHLSRRCAREVAAKADFADLVIGAGDFCNQRRGLEDAMAMLGPLLSKAVLVPGNAESADELGAAAGPATVLHGQSVELAGLTIFGLGYAVPITPFGSWSCDLSDCVSGQAFCHGLPSRRIALSTVRSLRMAATRAALAGRPRALRRR